LIIEAVAYYYLWLWHSCFDHPGSLNAINVWDKSPLLQEYLAGTFSEGVDFAFEINGTVFHQVHCEKMCFSFFVFFNFLSIYYCSINQVWFLVDGIYPDLARFVKTMSELSTQKICKMARGFKERC